MDDSKLNHPISIITPAFNMRAYIADCIESVIRQTYQNWELIIVDDGSTDNTADVVKRYQKDPRIRYYYQKNGGQAKARNYAIEKSTGEYIAFLDADDLWLPQRLSMSLKFIGEGNYDLFFSDCYVFENGTEPDEKKMPKMGVEDVIYSGENGLNTFLKSNRIPNLTVLVKKESLQRAGKFIDLRAAEDYDMWLRLLHQGAVFRAASTPLAAYRIRNDSITALDRGALFESLYVVSRFLTAHPEFKEAALPDQQMKFKHWLYHGHRPGNKKYRALISHIYKPLASTFLYGCSFLLPFKYLRKLTNRLV